MKKSSDMIRKIMLNYAFTFMMIELADAASMVIDGLVVSRGLGPTQLASVGLADPAFQMLSIFSCVVAIGVQSLCSAAMGAGDQKRANEVFSCGLLVIVVGAGVLTVLGFSCVDPLCRLFGADGSDAVLYHGLRDYLKGWFFGIPGFIGFRMLSPLVTLDGNKRCVTVATVTQSAINILGDFLSVTALGLGTFGIGLFSGLGFDVALLILLSNFMRKRSTFTLRLGRFDIGSIRSIVRIGMPKLTKYLCKMLAPILINRTIIAIGGSIAMSAMAVKSSIGNFCLVAGAGIAESVNLMTQVFYSEKDSAALKEMAKTALWANAVFCSAFALLLFFLSPWVAGFYIPSSAPEYPMTVLVLRCLALSLALNGINSATLCYLQGARKIFPAHLQTASHRLVFLAVCTFLLGRLFGTPGLFAAIPVSEALVLLCYLVLALLHGKNRNLTDALMLLPENFGYQKEDSLSFTLTQLDAVAGISRQIGAFCTERGIDRRRAYYASLCAEEIAGNVVDHGFKKDHKSHSCEVRVMIEDGDIILRIRDDCRYFNLKERYEAMDKDDPTANVGIRLVYGIAKDVNYVNLLGTNTLIIRV